MPASAVSVSSAGLKIHAPPRVIDYWLSTPLFTVWVQVRADRIVDCANYLKRDWRGQSWKRLLALLERRHGGALRWKEL